MTQCVLDKTPFYLFSFYNPQFKYRRLPIYFDNAAVAAVQIPFPQDNTLSGARIVGISVITPSVFDQTLQTNENNGQLYITMPQVDQAKFVLNLYNNSDCIIQNYPVTMLQSLGYRGSNIPNKAKMLATDFKFQTADSFLKKTSALPLTGNFQCLTFEFLYIE
jgi:hypothetical protein